MRVRCKCGREAVLNRPGKRKNCRKCGRDLRDAKPTKPRAVSIKATAKKTKKADPPIDPAPSVDPDSAENPDSEGPPATLAAGTENLSTTEGPTKG